MKRARRVQGVRRLRLGLIRLDFQPPECLDLETVMSYTDRMNRRNKIEPVLVYYEGAEYWLNNGFHRFQAALNAGRKTITAKVVPGSLADMEAEWQRYLRALKSELRQGLPRLDQADWNP